MTINRGRGGRLPGGRSPLPPIPPDLRHDAPSPWGYVRVPDDVSWVVDALDERARHPEAPRQQRLRQVEALLPAVCESLEVPEFWRAMRLELVHWVRSYVEVSAAVDRFDLALSHRAAQPHHPEEAYDLFAMCVLEAASPAGGPPPRITPEAMLLQAWTFLHGGEHAEAEIQRRAMDVDNGRPTARALAIKTAFQRFVSDLPEGTLTREQHDWAQTMLTRFRSASFRRLRYGRHAGQAHPDLMADDLVAETLLLLHDRYGHVDPFDLLAYALDGALDKLLSEARDRAEHEAGKSPAWRHPTEVKEREQAPEEATNPLERLPDQTLTPEECVLDAEERTLFEKACASLDEPRDRDLLRKSKKCDELATRLLSPRVADQVIRENSSPRLTLEALAQEFGWRSPQRVAYHLKRVTRKLERTFEALRRSYFGDL